LWDEERSKLRAMLGQDPNGFVSLTLFDTDGQDVASIGFNLDNDNRTELVLKGVDGEGKGLRLTVESDGKAGVRFLNIPSERIFENASETANSPQITIGIGEGNTPMMMVVDDAGRPRAQLGVMPDGRAAFILLDKDGNVEHQQITSD
jgi:hypothetical protein